MKIALPAPSRTFTACSRTFAASESSVAPKTAAEPFMLCAAIFVPSNSRSRDSLWREEAKSHKALEVSLCFERMRGAAFRATLLSAGFPPPQEDSRGFPAAPRPPQLHFMCTNPSEILREPPGIGAGLIFSPYFLHGLPEFLVELLEQLLHKFFVVHLLQHVGLYPSSSTNLGCPRQGALFSSLPPFHTWSC